MAIGLRRNTVLLEPHSEEWAGLALLLAYHFKQAVGDLPCNIKHIGSTALPIKAKPIVDLLVGVKDYEALFQYNEDLAKKGFVFRGSDQPNQYLYVVYDEKDPEVVIAHVHVVKLFGGPYRRYLAFRDYLLNHPAAAKRYEQLKEQLASQYPDDREAYTAGKKAFIAEILKLAKV